MCSRKPLSFLALAGIVFAVPALAQQASSYPPACEASKVTKGEVDRAHQVFLSGKQFLDESNYDKAISYFKDAYSIDCSVHAILPIIATAYERKGDKAEAVRALEEYLKRAPNAPDREVIERRIANLKAQLASAPATTGTPPPSTTATAAPIGTTAPTATAPATGEATASASTAAPTATTVSPAPEGGAHSLAPWIVVGAGGAAAVGGVVLYAIGAGDVSSASQACPSRKNCSQTVTDKGNNGRTLETVGAVLGGVGLAAVAGGLVWHFLEPTTPEKSTAAHVSPVVTPGYAGLGVSGAF